MNISNKTSIAFMCDGCGDFCTRDVNVFDFSGENTQHISCSCGETPVTIVKNGVKSYKIKIKCPICFEEHTLTLPPHQFWSGEIFILPCGSYEANVLFLGNDKKVESSLNDYLKNELDLLDRTAPIDELAKFTRFNETIEQNPSLYKFCDCEENILSVCYNQKECYIICKSCYKAKNIDINEICDVIIKNK